ncbi:MAG: hypothetical protein BM557_11840 [Flavobacterium sp. MedPE-SWcel]|uniref:T9SS type B sorting domain-containing protein n=1 Tax=uncultured Flavobacterium sp. TaxID=165435 RepID=UPI000921E80B|nr:T9SS type B sorting domain-containing protein [uncultured Flavobacterium sp.]OIQ15317.1 MAG: hypothetical protein BM557_11840 [Flavobacterium sp. MedPE-SWcel]
MYSLIVNGKTFAPINDNCTDATTLTVNTGEDCAVVATTSFLAATVSTEGNTCTATTTGDIWYQFVATSTSHTVSLSGFTGTAQPVAMVLYEGADCTTFTQEYCSINNVINATSLIIGETYKLRLYFNTTNPSLTGTTFNVCVTTPPPPTDNNQSDCVITTVNFDFELPVPVATTYPIFLNHNVVQGWRTTASDEIIEFWPSPNYENVPAYSGNQFIELNANLVSGVYQDYETPEVTTFSYGFAHRGRQGTDTCQLLAGPPGGPYIPVGSPVATGNSDWSYNTGTYDVPVGQTTTRFIFQSVSSTGGASIGNFLDAITFTANNGILSANPYYMSCGDLIASVSAAGTGTWVAHTDNPSVTTIADDSSNDTTITDFTSDGLYYYDWVTQYCITTLEISFLGDEVPEPVVADVTYCLGETAVPLTAEALPGNTINWFSGSAPTPSTTDVGTTNYYVSQLAPSGCESIAALIVVTVNPPGDVVTDFTLPVSVCASDAVVQPLLATDFTLGGIYTAEAGLAIDATTGEIDPVTSVSGDYNITYTIVANACTTGGSSTVPITINPLPEAPDFTLTHPDCFTNTGTITINSPVGAEYTYSINGIDYQSEVTFTNAPSGTYTLYVQNTAGCIITDDSVVINPTLIVPTAPDVTIIEPTCTIATGTVTVNSPIGIEYTYSINGIDYQSSPVFIDVISGNYTVTVQNLNSCEATTPIFVTPQPLTPISPTVLLTQPTCNIPSGTLTVTSPMGAVFFYSINGVDYQLNNTFSDLPQGNYTVTVMNSSGCTSSSNNHIINAPPVPLPSPQLSAVQPDCFTDTGIISVAFPLGTQYTYSIDGITFQTGTLFTDLIPATYTVLVKNTDGCVTNASININAAPNTPAVADVAILQPNCDSDLGTITINTPTGVGLTYSVDGVTFQQGTEFSGLASGDYTVTVKNTAGCISVTNPITIDPSLGIPEEPVITAIHPTCDTPTTGTIIVTTPVGTDYTYSINGFDYQTNTDFTDLTPGVTYNVTVKNAVGCTTTSLPLTIHDAVEVPPVPTITIVQTDCDRSRGIITVEAPVGDGIKYSINGISFQPNPIFTNVAPGLYTITVKNADGCTSSDTVEIYLLLPTSDPGVVDGPLQVCEGEIAQFTNTVVGGTWSVSDEDRATINDSGELTAISSGNFNVYYTFQNPNECPAIAELSVWVVGDPTPELDDVYLCLDIETGEYATVDLDTGLSEAQYSFAWYKDGGVLTGTGSNRTVNEPGEYSVEVTRLTSGCVGTATATVSVSSQAVVSIVVGEDFEYRQTITVAIVEGSGDYEYQLNNGVFQDEPIFTGITQGEYTITVRDKNGCGEVTTEVYALNYPKFFSPNGDGVRDTWFIEGLTGRETANIYIFDRYGKVVGAVTPGITGWDGTFDGEVLPATDYWFKLFYSSSDGIPKEFKAHFSLIR